MKRRNILKAGAVCLCANGLLPMSSWGASRGLRYVGDAYPFDYAWLKGKARSNAGKPFTKDDSKIPRSIKSLNWDQFQAISYRNDRALWEFEKLPFRVKFFHLGLYYQNAVNMFEVNNGKAREIAYDPELFDYGNSGLRGAQMPQNLGFAGFRVNFHTDLARDVMAFLGASYFRAVGGDWQYGLSARGLAVDCGLATAEEFPRFTAFWMERPSANADSMVIYALLESPSVTGAYRFEVRPGKTLVMDIDAALYPRKTIEQIGIAPLTSMFRCGENECRARNDWRPEIHDSDGLSMWRGDGEWIWRPLTDPEQLRHNTFEDNNPRGFGLLQRDRNFDHYQDDGVFYERRPSLWVEPKSEWGKGKVQLVEIPTDDETSDNIVAFWHPDAPALAGQELLFSYRLHWGAVMPFGSPLATVVATRTGPGGLPGQKRTHFSWRFVVDFHGGTLTMLAADTKPKAVVSASSGKIELVSARPLDDIHGYRAMFDLQPDRGAQPINLRLYLSFEGQPLTETWLYQWVPPIHRVF